MTPAQQTETNLRRLLHEARDLCRRAQDLRLAEAEQIGLERRFGELTTGTIVSYAFQGVLRRPVLDWLRRAELAIGTAKRCGESTAGAGCDDPLKQLRHLVDIANAAALRRSRSRETWTVFYSANEHVRQSAPAPEHRA